MGFAEIIFLVRKCYWKQKVLGNYTSCLIFCKSPLTYVNMRELNFAISCAGHVYLLISTIANELRAACILGVHCLAYHHRRKGISAHCAPCDEPAAVRDRGKSERPTKIDLASRCGRKAAIPVICDTRSRTEWKLDAVTWMWLAPRRRSGYFIEFSTVSIHAHTCCFSFFFCTLSTPSANQNLICAFVLTLYQRLMC